MRRVRYSVASSLDGYIAGPNGEFDWIMPNPEFDFAAHFAQFDTALIGRRTFQLMFEHGKPTLPGMKNYIFSRTLRPSDIPKSSILSTTPEQTVRELCNQAATGKDIWLFGGGELFRTLLAAHLVDTIELSLIPVLLGAGTPLAGSGMPLLPPFGKRVPLELKEHKVYKNGTVALTYWMTRDQQT
jgi:dihydrofolate reductase